MDYDKKTSVFLSLLLYICFFFSGASALVYQIIWTRKCSLLLGSTSLAVSSVLGIFFLGIGVGSFIGGKLANSNRNGVKIYGVLEIVIGLWALAITEYLSSNEIVAGVFKIIPSSYLLTFFVRIFFALLWFLVPAICMGMTYPVLAKHENLALRFSKAHLSILYMANTLGGTAGVFLAGFIAIPLMGYFNVILIAVTINLLVGVVAWIISPSFVERNIVGYENLKVTEGECAYDGENNYVLLMVYIGVFVSGFVTLALEVLWTRLLIMILLGTTYAYSSVLISVLAGIGLGSLLLSLVVSRIRMHLSHLGLGYFICALLVLSTILFISYLPSAIRWYGLEVSTNWTRAVLGKFLLTFMVLVPPMVAFGFTFPYALCLMRSVSPNPFVSIGRAYGVNTIGSILGSIFGGFVILPLMGCENGVKVLALALASFGIVIAFFSMKWRFISAILCLSTLTAFFLVLPTDLMREINNFYIPWMHRIIFFSEGVEGTVAVSAPNIPKPEDERILWINRVQATTAVEKGVRMNRFQGILPLLFDRNPQKVLFMCFGSGITCGTLAIADFQRIDAVEISPEVIEASKCFRDKNLDVLSRPNVNLHIDDARNYLIRSNDEYDFITLEPMPLALAGVSAFYSEDFYRFCFNVMSDLGMMSQWVPFHSTDISIVKSVVATFLKVFPEAKGFFINSDLFIVGAKKPLHLNPARFQSRLEANLPLRTVLTEAGFPDTEEVFATFVMDREALVEFSNGGRTITDKNPWVEFSAPKYVYYRGAVPENIRNLKKYFTPIDKVFGEDKDDFALFNSVVQRQKSHYADLDGVIKYYEGFTISDDLRESFINSLKIDPKNSQAKYYLRVIVKTQIESYIRWDELEKAKEILREVSPYLKDDIFWNNWVRNLDI